MVCGAPARGLQARWGLGPAVMQGAGPLDQGVHAMGRQATLAPSRRLMTTFPRRRRWCVPRVLRVPQVYLVQDERYVEDALQLLRQSMKVRRPADLAPLAGPPPLSRP